MKTSTGTQASAGEAVDMASQKGLPRIRCNKAMYEEQPNPCMDLCLPGILAHNLADWMVDRARDHY
jgi:hypothetical protein